MDIGFALPNLMDSDEMRLFAQSVENLGFESVWAADHIILPIEKTDQYPYTEDGSFTRPSTAPFLETLTMLSFLAACTERVRVGSTVVIVPYRNPVLQAKMFASVDVLSKGRAVCGVGVGWLEKEFQTLDVPYADRGPMTDEWLTIFKDLWTSEFPEHKGKYYRYDAVQFYPKPIQKPHIPIWVGGHTRRAIRRVVKYGDAWHPTRQTPEWMESQLPYMREFANEFGRDPKDITLSLKRTLHFTDTGAEEGSQVRSTGSMIGTTREVIDDIKRCQEIGITQLTYDFRTPDVHDCIRTMQHVAEKVVPVI